jgi:N-acetylglucosaminyldiphosphoundecaprenol N-acetyl-beta-D-mannosaminyltransferase
VVGGALGKIDRIPVAGVRFHRVSRREVLDLMEVFIAHGASRMICTPNADHVVRARREPEFKQILERADLVVADGMAVIYAARFLGTPLQDNVGGRLLLDAFAARAAARGYRLFLLGGRDARAAEAAADSLRARHRGLLVAGTYSPPFVPEFDEAETCRIMQAIHRAAPDALFVGVGTPKQEKWIARNLDRLEVPVSVGVGAALDMLAGRVRVPPRWMTEVGLEWLCKLLQEPQRFWRRYLVDDPMFFWWVLRQRLGWV